MTLGINFDGIIICLECFVKELQGSEYPNLLACTCNTKKVKEKDICPFCNQHFDNKNNDLYCDFIISYLK